MRASWRYSGMLAPLDALRVLTPAALMVVLSSCEVKEPERQSSSVQQQAPQQQAPVRPYLVPANAAKNEIMTWSKDQVFACFGPPKDSDQVAGWPRYWFQRDQCSEWIMFNGEMVHAVQGYGAEQECWWVVNECAD